MYVDKTAVRTDSFINLRPY